MSAFAAISHLNVLNFAIKQSLTKTEIALSCRSIRTLAMRIKGLIKLQWDQIRRLLKPIVFQEGITDRKWFSRQFQGDGGAISRFIYTIWWTWIELVWKLYLFKMRPHSEVTSPGCLTRRLLGYPGDNSIEVYHIQDDTTNGLWILSVF